MHARHSFRGFGAAALLAGLLLTPSAFARAPEQESVSQRPSDAQLERISVASGHHDLALLLIKKGNDAGALAEARKILELGLSAEHETLVASSMAIITEKLGDARKFESAHGLLDDALKALETASARSKVMIVKARLYTRAGDDDRAIETYNKAFEISRRSR